MCSSLSSFIVHSPSQIQARPLIVKYIAQLQQSIKDASAQISALEANLKLVPEQIAYYTRIHHDELVLKKKAKQIEISKQLKVNKVIFHTYPMMLSRVQAALQNDRISSDLLIPGLAVAPPAPPDSKSLVEWVKKLEQTCPVPLGFDPSGKR